MQSPSPELAQLLKPTVVRAGAGAGKTTRLVAQVLHVADSFFKQEGRYPNLVLTTFTKKATQELKERLMSKAVEANDERLLDYLTGPQLHVSTIHGVLSLFLKRYGHLAGLDNAFVMMSSIDSRRMASSLLKQLVKEDEGAAALMAQFGFHRLCRILIRLAYLRIESPQIKAVSLDEMKTSSLEVWIDFVDRHQSDLEEILTETEDKKYTDYIQTLFSIFADLTSGGEDPELVGRALARLPKKPSFKAKDPQLPAESDKKLSKIAKDLKALAGRAELNPEFWSRSVELFDQLDDLSQRFTEGWYKLKLEQARLDSNDLELMALRILTQHPELGEAFSKDFDYWLVDEYQDTSPLQVTLLKSLTGEKSQFIVGDPQQSIYLFRGSDSEVFRHQEQAMLAGGGEFEKLERNYRSQPPLLEFFNSLFTGVSDEFQAMLPKAEVKDAEVVATIAVTKPEHVDEDPHYQYRSIASHIEAKIEDGASFEDICILARTNTQLKAIASYLKYCGFPTHLHASGGFFERREISDALLLLRFLLNPLDDKNLVALLRSPWFKVSDVDLSAWLFDRRSPYWPSLVEESESPVIAGLKDAISQLASVSLIEVFEQTLLSTGLLEFSRKQDATGRSESNLWKLLHLLRQEEKMPGFSYLRFAEGLSSNDDGEQMDGESDAIASLEPNHIQLMTVHASKGLQFEHVILPHLEKAPLPARTPLVTKAKKGAAWSCPLPLGENEEWVGNAVDLREKLLRSEEEAKESLRVFYVAATRAKSSLFMSFQDGALKDKSWASRLPFKTKEEGVHKGSLFSYEVIHSPFAEVSRKLDSGSSVKPSPKYAAVKTESFTQRSVTSLVKEQEENQVGDESKQGLEALPSQMLPKIFRKTADGVYFHRVMEALHYRDDFDYQSMAEAWFDREASEVVKAIEWTLILDEPPMSHLLKQGKVEFGFQFLQDNQIIEGQIDLWGEKEGTVWVVDYKTGKSSEVEKALMQLRIYAKALRASGREQPIKLAVLFPMEQSCVVEDFGP